MSSSKSPPPFPYDPRTNTIQLPSDVVHELFHLVKDGNKVEAIKRVMELTGAGLKAAKDYVDTLLQRR
jgi:ribosomal protein L7/L12